MITLFCQSLSFSLSNADDSSLAVHKQELEAAGEQTLRGQSSRTILKGLKTGLGRGRGGGRTKQEGKKKLKLCATTFFFSSSTKRSKESKTKRAKKKQIAFGVFTRQKAVLFLFCLLRPVFLLVSSLRRDGSGPCVSLAFRIPQRKRKK